MYVEICLARPHLGFKYTGPFSIIMDAFIECYNHWLRDSRHKPIHRTWNCEAMIGDKQHRDPKDIEQSSVIVIPSESEFTHYIKGFYGPMMKKSYDAKVEEFKRALELGSKKTIIVLQSDLEDNRDLYENHILAGVTNVERLEFIEESSITRYGVYALKYHNLARLRPDLSEVRKYNFAYWGTSKKTVPSGNPNGNIRHEVIKKLNKLLPHQLYIGKLAQAKIKFQPMGQLINTLHEAQSTCCFNTNSKALTARYHEAMGLGLIPFIWHDYDSGQLLNELPYQRIHTPESLADSIRGIGPMVQYKKIYNQILDRYNLDLPSKQDIYRSFTKKMDSLI